MSDIENIGSSSEETAAAATASAVPAFAAWSGARTIQQRMVTSSSVDTYHRTLHVLVPNVTVPRPHHGSGRKFGVVEATSSCVRPCYDPSTEVGCTIVTDLLTLTEQQVVSPPPPAAASAAAASERFYSASHDVSTRKFGFRSVETGQRDPRCGMILFDPFTMSVLLVLNKVRHNNDPIKWSLPKGLQERHEMSEKCALRELGEETGFTMSIRYLRQHSRKVLIHQNTYFIVWVDSSKIRLDPKDKHEIERAEFMPLAQLGSIACNCDLRRWRDQSFPRLLPSRQGDVVSVWGQSPLRFRIYSQMLV